MRSVNTKSVSNQRMVRRGAPEPCKRMGGSRSKRKAIVAVARKLLVELWHYVEHGVVPDGAILTNESRTPAA